MNQQAQGTEEKKDRRRASRANRTIQVNLRPSERAALLYKADLEDVDYSVIVRRLINEETKGLDVPPAYFGASARRGRKSLDDGASYLGASATQAAQA